MLVARTNAIMNKAPASQIGTAAIETITSGKHAMPAAPKRTGRSITTPIKATMPGAARAMTMASVGSGPSTWRSPIEP